ncbi:MAG: hypothetical protein E7Z80_08015 [Methanobrevibacter thaueri]|nr:hypothetical protein [Methanobrevibacter thaueri]
MTSNIKNILKTLKKDSEIIYTEQFLEEIEKRNLLDGEIEDLILLKKPKKIKKYTKHENRYQITYELNKCSDIIIIIDLFNNTKIILISSIPINKKYKPEYQEKPLDLTSTYDMAFDILNLESTDTYRYLQSIEVDEGIYIDWDNCGTPIGMELISISKKFKLKARKFSSSIIEGTLTITKNTIKIELTNTLNVVNFKPRHFESETENTLKIPEGKFNFKTKIIPD